ncbi:MAG: DNA methylase, partial [Clostridia bacterium]|nr:DNA methylase [Clostridia bacterium]
MAEALALNLGAKGLVTDQIVLAIGYDIDRLRDPAIRSQYQGAVTTDPYGRQIPQHAHGSCHLGTLTSSTRRVVEAALAIFDRTVNPILLVRRLNIVAARILPEPSLATGESIQQLDFFSTITESSPPDHRERQLQQATLRIHQRFGKNALVKGTNLQEGATAMERNMQIGGHKA